MTKVFVYDTTLRDGTQGEGISLTVEDKLKIAKRLDDFGVDYIEGGWPGSNPKDMEFFMKAKELSLQHAKITAFGSTRRSGVEAKDDQNLNRLIESGVKVATIFGKTWDFHVTEALKTTLDDNLQMIEESVRYLKENGLEVIFDAEHFFDGCKQNEEYALKALQAAERGGADCLVLCDTNGGTLPFEIGQIISKVTETLHTPVGIHCHNDSECGVANTIEAVRMGARHIQGTMNGYGERCGNANLISVLPNLQLKMGFACIPEEQMKQLTKVSRYVHEIANVNPANNQPFVGMSAFAHKGGMHVSAILKAAKTYEHLTPEDVGNKRRVLVSELSGQSNLLYKAKEFEMELDKSSHETKELIQTLKEKEHEGYQYEGAEASFELLVKESLGQLTERFTLDSFKIMMEKGQEESIRTEAIVKIKVGDEYIHTVAEGNGPVNALDHALRKALEEVYPTIKTMYLSDYKVRVLDEKGATAAKVRVLIDSTDGKRKWTTVGVSTNIIEASWQALSDSMRFLLMDVETPDMPKHDEKRQVGIHNH